jgi:hypothetical protein
MLAGDILAVEVKPVLKSTMSKNGTLLGPLMSSIVEIPQSNEGPDSRESHSATAPSLSPSCIWAFHKF